MKDFLAALKECSQKLQDIRERTYSVNNYDKLFPEYQFMCEVIDLVDDFMADCQDFIKCHQ